MMNGMSLKEDISMRRCINAFLAMAMLLIMSAVVYAAEPVPEYEGNLTAELIAGTAKVLAETYSSRNPGFHNMILCR